MKVYRIIKHRTNEVRSQSAPLLSMTLAALEDLVGNIDDHGVGDTFSVRVVDMSQDAFENLEEWGGW